MIAPAKHHDHPTSFEVRILRQEGPSKPSHWERHQVTYEPNLNVISVLQKIAAQATTAEGETTTPVAWDCNCLGRGLRGVHDARQRPDAPGVFGTCRQTARRGAGQHRTAGR